MPETKPKFLKMSVFTALSKIEVTKETETMIKKSANFIAEGRKCYSRVQSICTNHKIVVIADKKVAS
ncbi:hypothetical protein D6B99_11930 [Arachidicoccus soli]|uniref:Uncharacterized protein n=2 Tax=Arachidicoccus soli TaxID=2341117 RepID=A0A386HQN0_9BACT|nr:hypothetical protein D6B99_11930 [Arachidicoccus soli]